MARVPWRKLDSFVESLGAEHTLDGLLDRAMEACRTMVGYDFAIAVYTLNDFSRFRSLRSRNAPDSLIAQYLLYYHSINDWLPRYRERPLQRTAWRFQRRGEFRNWVLDSGIRHSLGISDLSDGREQGYVLGLMRHGRRWFTEYDKWLMARVQRRLGFFVDAMIRPEIQMARRLQEAAATAGLTSREQEVAVPAALRYRTPEIAERLFISPHTVEKHLEHIYLKLEITNREQLRRRLLGETDPGEGASPWGQISV
ncbi:MAG TPA: helix-turn-helix transcriptional regulator [Spirochaetia bacterium]|nr:helix-turn-helix transcriptional regulator [Spirochaetia bacterium]